MTHQVNNIIPENSLHYASIPANRNTCLPTKLELAGRSIDQTQQFFIPNAFTNANFGRFEQSAMASFFSLVGNHFALLAWQLKLEFPVQNLVLNQISIQII